MTIPRTAPKTGPAIQAWLDVGGDGSGGEVEAGIEDDAEEPGVGIWVSLDSLASGVSGSDIGIELVRAVSICIEAKASESMV